jgi:hypothetical protein
MNLSKLARNPRAIKALIGLSYQEFIDLVPTFEKVLTEMKRENKNRIRAIGGGRKGALRTTEAKLFFILFYLKTYPTFDVLGFFFSKPRGRSCEHTHFLMHVLKRSLGREFVLPKRKIRSVEEFLQVFPEVKDVFGDGTERRIQRPKKPKREHKTYSGKKKAHTRKNVILSDERRRILIVSPTKSGRRHDKRLADKILLAERLPPHIGFFGDSAFQGIQHVHPNACIPKRGTKKHPLTESERADNHLISSFRMVIENAISGIKRFRALVDVLRNKIGRFDDDCIEICAGLWNYHLRYALK